MYSMTDNPSASMDWIGLESSGRHAGHGQDDYDILQMLSFRIIITMACTVKWE